MNGSFRIDQLVGQHAANLSEQLQAHRQQLYPPDTKRVMRRFTSGEVDGPARNLARGAVEQADAEDGSTE